jgi:succinyl-diaminopimelate desuccinylase
MKNLLKKLIKAETTVQKGEFTAANIIAAEFEKSDIYSQVEVWDENRANITAHIKSSGQRPALLFACHLDVVGQGEEKWKYPPFEAAESDGKIHGRGSADMKGGTVAAITAIKQLVDSGSKFKGDIVFLASAGEETDSCGIKRFIHDFSGKLPEFGGIIIPEPTNFDIITAHRGAFWLKITTKGKTAHGSTPHLGINAIESARKVMDELDDFKKHSLPDGCSMSINTISAGNAVNVVPDECTIGIDIRTIAQQDHQKLVTDFEHIFAKLKQKDPQFQAQLAVTRNVEALATDDQCDFVKDFCACLNIRETKSVGFCTDGPFLVPLGAPVVIFGPGKPEICHKPNEYIEIKDLQKAVKLYKKIIKKFLL